MRRGYIKKGVFLAVGMWGIFSLAACGSIEKTEAEEAEKTEAEALKEDTDVKCNVQIGGRDFTVILEKNEAAEAFYQMMEEPLVIKMSDYAGFEKVGALGTSLPASDSRMTTQAGDIVLYNSDQIVLFYGSNSWSYTKLGRIDNLAGWEEALGHGGVEAVFSIGG